MMILLLCKIARNSWSTESSANAELQDGVVHGTGDGNRVLKELKTGKCEYKLLIREKHDKEYRLEMVPAVRGKQYRFDVVSSES